MQKEFSMVVFYLSKIPSLPLDLTTAGGWIWAGIVFEPMKEAGPILAIAVPMLIHLFKFIEGRIEKRELKQRVTEIEKKAAEIELEKQKLQNDFLRFEQDRAAFREEQRNAVNNILCHVENMSKKMESEGK